MSLKYIRENYKVPAFKGARVKARGCLGVITGAGGEWLRVRLDGWDSSCTYHPVHEIEYLPADEPPESSAGT